MARNGVPDFNELLSSAQRSAVHLEMRDLYAVGDEVDASEHFERTREADLNPESPFWQGWTPTVRETPARGVEMRRAPTGRRPPTRPW